MDLMFSLSSYANRIMSVAMTAKVFCDSAYQSFSWNLLLIEESTTLSKLYVFFWVITWRLDFICRRFGTLCSIFIGR